MENLRKPYVIWTVKGREIKLKLTTADVVNLESKYKCNLMSLLGNSNGFTPLSVMLDIVQRATNKYEHGLKYEDIQSLYDDYLEGGGSQIEFALDVFMEVFKVSGFLSKAQVEQMDKELAKAKEQ